VTRIALETGMHSPWVSRLLSELGHEVIVAHARNVRLIGELAVGKPVVVRFNPKNPASNDLELDSWTYTNDRPTSLNI
jgi:hypothetical protein